MMRNHKRPKPKDVTKKGIASTEFTSFEVNSAAEVNPRAKVTTPKRAPKKLKPHIKKRKPQRAVEGKIKNNSKILNNPGCLLELTSAPATAQHSKRRICPGSAKPPKNIRYKNKKILHV